MAVTGTSLGVQVETAGFPEIAAKFDLLRSALMTQEPVWGRVAEVAIAGIDSDWGEGWAPLASSTAAQKSTGYSNPMVMDWKADKYGGRGGGELKMSLTKMGAPHQHIIFSAHELTIGTDLWYAHFAQKGTRAHHKAGDTTVTLKDPFSFAGLNTSAYGASRGDGSEPVRVLVRISAGTRQAVTSILADYIVEAWA
jgi:hypothetical protein